MKRKIQLIIGVLIMSALIASPAFCDGSRNHPGPGPRGEGPEDKMAEIEKKLNLTPEQDKLLKEAKTAHRAEMESMMQTMDTKHKELQAEIAKPGVTKQQIEPIANQIKALQSQMVDHRIDGILKIKHILSPEQFKKLESLKEERHHKGPPMKCPEER
jgi:Spy/CpxP family protein refolding chaperone